MRQNVLDQSAGLAAMVGGGSTRPRPPVLTPQGPAIANHLINHDAHNPEARRLAMLLMQGTEVPEHRTGRDT